MGSAVAWALDALPGSSRTPRGGVAPPRRARAGLVRPARRVDVGRGPGGDEPAPPRPSAGHVGAGRRGGALPAARAGPRDRRGDDARRRAGGPHRVAVARLRAIAGAVGGLENQADHPRWPPSRPSSATCATGSPGWSAPRRASTSPWPWPCRWRRSAWGQKAQCWIDEHLGAVGEPDPLLWARRSRRVVVRGFFSGTTDTPQDLEARRTSPASTRSGRCGSACAAGWRSPACGAATWLPVPPCSTTPSCWRSSATCVTRGWARSWSGAERCSSPRASSGALDLLQMVTSRFHELDDASSVLSSLYLRSYIARISGDDERSAAELRSARRCASRAARATQALVGAELAQHERRMGGRARSSR